MTQPHILIDAREFLPGRITGIGRFLQGLICSLSDMDVLKILLVVYKIKYVPSELWEKSSLQFQEAPINFFTSEKLLSDLSRSKYDVFISPYRKLPLFGCYCKSVITVHDVLDLTMSIYAKRLKRIIDIFRLKRDLRQSDLTWFVSSWALYQTNALVGFSGNNPKIRYQPINEKFFTIKTIEEDVLARYGLTPGYILSLGNGLPHKNLGVLLQISGNIKRSLVFAGISKKNKLYWEKRFPKAKVTWIEYVHEEDLPSIISSAFCLAHSSIAEGYGYPPLEAMACRVPAVVSRIPVLVETTGGNALTAESDKPNQWRKAFDSLEDRRKYAEQVEKGALWLQLLRENKLWEKYVTDILELAKV